jgi:hypothetical protein
MAKRSSTYGRRLRSVAVAGLIVGTTGAFFPGRHAAHAAVAPNSCFMPVVTLTSGFPKSSTGSVQETFNLGPAGSLTVNINGNNQVTGLNDSKLASCPTGTFAATASSFSGSIQYTDRDNVTQTCSLDDAEGIDIQSGQTTGNDPNKNRVEFGNGATLVGQVTCSNNATMKFDALIQFIGSGGPGGAAATPELGSGELLATGLVPALGIVLYRRRRQRRADK